MKCIIRTANLRRIALVITLLISCTSLAFGQRTANFSGTWNINLEKSDPGAAPVNSLSKQMKIKQDGNSITIERIVGDKGSEMNGVETLSFDGKFSKHKMSAESDVIKNSNLKWSDDKQSFTETASYSRDNDNDFAKLTEIWKLSNNDQVLTVERILDSGAHIKMVYDKEAE